MHPGELFRITEGSEEQKQMIFRVEETIDPTVCENCAGNKGNNPLCRKLPYCGYGYKFVELTTVEAKRALERNKNINQY